MKLDLRLSCTVSEIIGTRWPRRGILFGPSTVHIHKIRTAMVAVKQVILKLSDDAWLLSNVFHSPNGVIDGDNESIFLSLLIRTWRWLTLALILLKLYTEEKTVVLWSRSLMHLILMFFFLYEYINKTRQKRRMKTAGQHLWRLSSLELVFATCQKTYQQWRHQDLLRGGALTVDFRAGCSSCSMTNSFVTNTVLIDMKELWVVDICTSWFRRLHNISIIGCQIYFKMN